MHGHILRHRRFGNDDKPVVGSTVRPEVQEAQGVITHLDEIDLRRPVTLQGYRDIPG